MTVIGLTGGIATGKSTALATLRALGAPVCSADALARAVTAPGSRVLGEIAGAFGPEVLRPDGSLDRPRLAELAFSQPAARRQLEAVTHPAILRGMRCWVDVQRAAAVRAVVCDIPLLFEVGLDRPGSFIQRIWLVTCPPDAQLDRLMRRDGLERPQAEARVAAQWPQDIKVAGADRLLDNAGPPSALAVQTEAAWRGLLSESRAAPAGRRH